MLCVAIGRHSIAGLTASVSIAYSAAAVVALAALARHQVNIASVIWSRHVRRSLTASLVAALVMALAYSAPTWNRGAGLVARFSLALAGRALRLHARRRAPPAPGRARGRERCKAELDQGGAMARIRVVTDSACDIPEEIARRLDIDIVSLSIRFGDEEFTDRVDLTPSEFWAKCKASKTLPETAAPSPGAFQAAYERAKADGLRRRHRAHAFGAALGDEPVGGARRRRRSRTPSPVRVSTPRRSRWPRACS